MALSVDSLLAAESSSDEDNSEALQGQRKPNATASGDAAEREAATGAGAAEPPPQRRAVELTVEEALAQQHFSDDEDEDLTALLASRPEVAPKQAQQLDEDQDGSEGSQLDAQVAADKLASLDEVLAMDSDSSDDGKARTGLTKSTVPPPDSTSAGSELVPKAQTTESSASVNKPDNQARLATTAEIADDEEAFLRSPFEWCMEHERRLLSVGSPADVGASEALSSSGAKTGQSEVAKLLSTMVETKSCTELERRAQELGRPACVAAQARSVAIGTLRGMVVFLDAKAQDVVGQPQVLQPISVEDAVPVTALAFSPDGSSMLVGHKHGLLVLWDLASQKPAHVLKDAHSTAVIAVGFYGSAWQHVLSADARGAVLILTYGSSFGRRDCSKSMLFEPSSQLGTVLRISPLPMVPQHMEHPADNHRLVALCATNATLLLQMHPNTQLLQRMQYHAKDASAQATWLPDVAWLRPSPEMREWAVADGAQEPCDPLLCIAFGQKIHIMRVSFDGQAKPKEQLKIALVQTFVWGSPLQSLVAFSDSVLGLLDGANKLSIVQLPAPPAETGDAKMASKGQSLVALQANDTATWSVVYHTNTSSSSSGPKQDAGQEARSRHCALAVLRRGRTLYVCGMKEVWSIRIDRWGQRIEDLVKKSKWGVASEVFIGLHKGTLPALLDFPVVESARKRAAGSRATQFLQSYLNSSLQPDTAKTQVRNMCYMAVSACVEMGLWASLYKTVFECFKASGHMSVYCNMLEPFIVHGRIPRGEMDSEVLSSILQSYQVALSEEEQLVARMAAADGRSDELDCDHFPELFPTARRLQQLVLYVDIAQLDLNFGIRLFTQYRLWTALLHVYCSLKDYVTPLELLVGECSAVAKRSSASSQAQTGSDEALLLGSRLTRKLFFFLSRCLELKPFPLDAKDMGTSGTSLALTPVNISEVLTCILKPTEKSTGTDEYVRAPPMFMKLLRLSPVGLFRSLAVLFTVPMASHAVQSLAASDSHKLPGCERAFTLKNVFLAVEAAVEACKLQASADGLDLPKNVDSEFLFFTAKAATRGGDVSLSQDRCMQVVSHILNAVCQDKSDGKSYNIPACRSNSEAEQLVIQLLAAQDSVDQGMRSSLIAKALSHEFFQLASWLHEENGDYGEALACRLKDLSCREDIFEYIISRVSELSDVERVAALIEATLQRLPDLVAIDADRSTAMVCVQFANVDDYASVLGHLQAYPEMELQFLETLLSRHQNSPWKSTEEQQRFLDSHVIRYLELLCMQRPSAVLPFLTEHEALPLQRCLELCRKHTVTDASVYLLERTGDFSAVLELVLMDYAAALEQLHSTFTAGKEASKAAVARAVKRLAAVPPAHGVLQVQATPIEQPEPWYQDFPEGQRCVELTENANELSARNSNLMSQEQLEELWFGILGRTIRWQEKARQSKDVSKRHAGVAAAFADLASQAIAGVLAYLSLPRALRKVTAEFQDSHLSVWKEPLQQMLSGLSFQQGLLVAAKDVSAQDVMKPFLRIKRQGSRGVRVPPSIGAVPPGGLKVALGTK